MVIDSIEGSPVTALKPPPSTPDRADAMLAFAARVALAGTHKHDATLTANDGHGSVTATVAEAAPELEEPATLSWPAPGVAVIRLNNSIGSDALPPAFDKLMREAGKANTILLDLRDTPSGGDSSVAKPLMSWFVKGTQGYQTHQRGSKTWTEQVIGRRDYFRGRLIVLVDHWTGSMGEGAAIGLRSAAHAVLVGTPMAGLRGAIEGDDLPCSKINFRLPVERLFEVNGGPRELAKPDVLVSEQELAGGTRRATDDVILEKALDYARAEPRLGKPTGDP
jgi:carboxyl-terminal processing protease